MSAVTPILASLLATVGLAALGEWWWLHRAQPTMLKKFAARMRRLEEEKA